MSDFERAMPNVRLVQTHRGDDLQAVAARELGDANRWAELVWLNDLAPPYLTDREDLVTDGVRLTGGQLNVPAPAGTWVPDAGKDHAFERDCRLSRGLLAVAEDGDLAIVGGADNLRQQLVNRVATPRGQMRRHPGYGCMLWRLVGRVNGATAGALGAEYARATLAAEYRVYRVLSSVAEVQGDRIAVTAKAEAVDGQVIDVVVGTALPTEGGEGWGYHWNKYWGN